MRLRGLWAGLLVLALLLGPAAAIPRAIIESCAG